MLKSAIALSVVLAFGAVSAAIAQDSQIKGTIRSLDSVNRTVTLDNGQMVRLGPGTDMTGLREGGTIDETCSGRTAANCSLIEPDSQGPAAEESSPEDQTAPSAGSNSPTPPPSSMGTDNTTDTGPTFGTGDSSGTPGTSGSNGGGNSGSGSGSGSGSSGN